MAKTQVNLRIDEELDARLEHLARRTGRTKTFYAIQAITEFLEDREDYFLAKDSLEGYRESGDIALGIDEVDWGPTPP